MKTGIIHEKRQPRVAFFFTSVKSHVTDHPEQFSLSANLHSGFAILLFLYVVYLWVYQILTELHN